MDHGRDTNQLLSISLIHRFHQYVPAIAGIVRVAVHRYCQQPAVFEILRDVSHALQGNIERL